MKNILETEDFIITIYIIISAFILFGLHIYLIGTTGEFPKEPCDWIKNNNLWTCSSGDSCIAAIGEYNKFHNTTDIFCCPISGLASDFNILTGYERVCTNGLS